MPSASSFSSLFWACLLTFAFNLPASLISFLTLHYVLLLWTTSFFLEFQGVTFHFCSAGTVSKPGQQRSLHCWWLLASSTPSQLGFQGTEMQEHRPHGRCKAQQWPSDLDKTNINILHHLKKLEVSQLKPFLLQPTFQLWVSYNDFKQIAQHHKPFSCSFWLPFS